MSDNRLSTNLQEKLRLELQEWFDAWVYDWSAWLGQDLEAGKTSIAKDTWRERVHNAQALFGYSLAEDLTEAEEQSLFDAVSQEAYEQLNRRLARAAKFQPLLAPRQKSQQRAPSWDEVLAAAAERDWLVRVIALKCLRPEVTRAKAARLGEIFAAGLRDEHLAVQHAALDAISRTGFSPNALLRPLQELAQRASASVAERIKSLDWSQPAPAEVKGEQLDLLK